MKKIILLLSLFLFGCYVANAQTITGKLVDQNGNGLSALQLQLYISPKVYNATSSSDGSFTFSNITNVKDQQLPIGYAVSENFPNPFNPKTRIGITLPNNGSVRVGLYNLLGQKVKDEIERYFSAGTNYIDIELNGLPNGFYLARITLDEKYFVTKKLMLMYGSQHLNSASGLSNFQLKKSTLDGNSILDTRIDSLVVTSTIIGKKKFTNLPWITGNSLNLGSLIIERFCPGTPTVTYAGKTYNTVQIGNQCWIKENIDVGIMIQRNQGPTNNLQTNNGVIEKYCYNNEPINCTTYGGLYQLGEAIQYVTTEKTQGICPGGWHIPSRTEFQTLIAAVNNDGNALKAIGQGIGDGVGTDKSGFSLLLAGNGGFSGLYNSAFLWGSTNDPSIFGNYTLSIYDTRNDIYTYAYDQSGAFSVRCIKD